VYTLAALQPFVPAGWEKERESIEEGTREPGR